MGSNWNTPRSRLRSKPRFAARRGNQSRTSSRTAAAPKIRGQSGSPNARDARPPMTDDRTTLASATNASGSFEVGKDLSLRDTLRPHVPARLPGELGVKAPLHVVWQIGLVPGHEEAGWHTVPSDENRIARTQYRRGMITEVAERRDFHVTTSVATIATPRLRPLGANWASREHQRAQPDYARRRLSASQGC